MDNAMDAITALALSVNNPMLTAIGNFIGNDIAYVLVVAALFLVAERRNGKRLKIIAALLLTVALGTVVKQVMAHQRPCAGLDWCPDGYSFPSMHAAVAFTLMIAFLDKKSFPLFLVFALFVSFTRLNLGVHVFLDVAAALPIAVVSYYITDLAYERLTATGGKHGP